MPDATGREIPRCSFLKFTRGPAGGSGTVLLGLLIPPTLNLFTRHSAGAPAELDNGRICSFLAGRRAAPHQSDNGHA
jgi:hypothetical protein